VPRSWRIGARRESDGQPGLCRRGNRSSDVSAIFPDSCVQLLIIPLRTDGKKTRDMRLWVGKGLKSLLRGGRPGNNARKPGRKVPEKLRKTDMGRLNLVHLGLGNKLGESRAGDNQGCGKLRVRGLEYSGLGGIILFRPLPRGPGLDRKKRN